MILKFFGPVGGGVGLFQSARVGLMTRVFSRRGVGRAAITFGPGRRPACRIDYRPGAWEEPASSRRRAFDLAVRSAPSPLALTPGALNRIGFVNQGYLLGPVKFLRFQPARRARARRDPSAPRSPRSPRRGRCRLRAYATASARAWEPPGRKKRGSTWLKSVPCQPALFTWLKLAHDSCSNNDTTVFVGRILRGQEHRVPIGVVLLKPPDHDAGLVPANLLQLRPRPASGEDVE